MKYILLPLVCAVMASCGRRSDTRTICGVTQPQENLPWLAHEIDSLKLLKEPGQVTLYTAEGQEYLNIQLLVQSCRPCSLHTCDGRKLQYPGDSALIRKIAASGSPELISEF